MELRDWITIGVTLATLVSSWGQFWVKERLFNPAIPSADPVLAALRSKSGVTFLAASGVVSATTIWLLVTEIQSTAPITRWSVFVMSALTVLAFLNIVLVHSVYVLRRLARLKQEIEVTQKLAQNASTLYWLR